MTLKEIRDHAQRYARSVDQSIESISVGTVGSFYTARIEDVNGRVSVLAAGLIMDYVGGLLQEAGAVVNSRPINGAKYHMGGVVANWEMK